MRLGGSHWSVRAWCDTEPAELVAYAALLRQSLGEQSSGIVLRDQVRRSCQRFVQASPPSARARLRRGLSARMAIAEEADFIAGAVVFVLREAPGLRRAYAVELAGGARGERAVRLLEVREFLRLRERLILGRPMNGKIDFGIDFRPFQVLPEETGAQADIGSGTQRLAGMIEAALQDEPAELPPRLLAWLGNRAHGGKALLFRSPPTDVVGLRRRLRQAQELLAGLPASLPMADLESELALLGLAPGWGRTVGAARETLALLARLLRDPRADDLAALANRLPLVSWVLLVSVHGWFAQKDVLGRPDTGGQVVYLLDQARALEKHLRRLWRDAGVEVEPEVLVLTRLIPDAAGSTCDQPLERIQGARRATILRVPFRAPDGEVLRPWISRFQVWPYLERFAEEAWGAIEKHWGAPPDFVVGNYADGNLTASLLARVWGVPLVVVAHALEKSKYLLSDLHWRDLEGEYRFSIHFLADVLATNTADIIQTSSYQEIAGSRAEMGQYETYEAFTLPGCYRVHSGFNIHSSRFMINPPGTDTERFHSWGDQRAGDEEREQRVAAMVEGATDVPGALGTLRDPKKPLLLTMARLDKIKNLTGLVRAFARRPALPAACNLLVVSGVTRLADSGDHEEREQIQLMHELLASDALQGCVRWLPAESARLLVADFYRFVARRRGVFVQPALYEAFGLTVIEAMACGLPVVATRYGGPASIIEDGTSGFLVDPNRPVEIEQAVLSLLAPPSGEERWESMSRAGLRRVHEHFSWPGHARRLIQAHGLYSLWHALFPFQRDVRRGYVEALHHLLLDRLVAEAWPELR